MANKLRVAIVGAGVIGLSLAWELARRGHKVTLFERAETGKKASWAGAGILTPANSKTATHPLDLLMALGSDLHREWARELFAATGIDNGYRRCGGLYIAQTASEKAALFGLQSYWQEYEIEHQVVGLHEHNQQFNGIKLQSNALVVYAPGESQLRNPDHLAALAKACRLAGVECREQARDVNWRVHGDCVQSIVDSNGEYSFDHYCCCAGAWSAQMLAAARVQLPMVPVRGQMLLFKLEKPLFRVILNEGSRYIVPRDSGHVLVGSSVEEAGFDESTTEEVLAELQAFARRLVPALTPERLEKSWSGLRPATYDGFPYVGRITDLLNGWVATGHFKSGLQMSVSTAVIMADLIEGRETIMDVRPFEPSRICP